MSSISGLPQELVYVLAFVGILLFQYLIKRYGPQPEEAVALPEPLLSEPPQAADSALAPPASGVAFGRLDRAETPMARHRYSRRSLMATRRDVQNAVVIATILGPCRAFEPHETR